MTIRHLLVIQALMVATGANASALVAQGHSTVQRIRVPFGIAVSVPRHWLSSRPEVSASLEGTDSASIIDLSPDKTGHLFLVGTVAGSEEASMEISVMSSNVSQSAVKTMSSTDLVSADRDFRRQITAAAEAAGVHLLRWHGTSQKQLGGCAALLRLYTFAYPGKPPMLMESYGVYRGSKSVQIRIQYPERVSRALLEQVGAVRNSLSLECTDLR